jgi:uncharacterized protein (TIGR02594 family)
MNTSLILYRHARKDLGMSEVSGPKSHPRIEYAIKTAAKWLDGDDSVTAWCGCLRGLWGIETGTGVPKDHFRAINWLNWGVAVDLQEAKQGDTVVISRPGGNHVALFDRLEGNRVFLLGGNQSNSTTIAPFPVARVKGVRRAA